MEDIASIFNYTYNIIDKWIKDGNKVLVHCMAGVSRSITIVTYYLMKKNNTDYLTTIRYIKRKRKIANPNIGFIISLIKAYEKNFV